MYTIITITFLVVFSFCSGLPAKLETASNGTTCPQDFGYYKGYCYHLGTSGGHIIWAEARDQCHTLGAELASIHSAFENAFLASLTNGVNTWMGLLNEGGEWAWIDGSLVDYTNWTPGQPDGSGNCGQFWTYNDMKWDDCACNGVSSKISNDVLYTEYTPQYICKVKAT